MPGEEECSCDISGFCTADSEAKGDVSSCIYCGKELIKRNGMWYTWDCDLHPKQRPQM